MAIETLIQIVCYIWVASELSLLAFRRSGERGKSYDSKSVVWLNVTIYGSLALAVMCFVNGFGYYDIARVAFAWIGLVLIVLGLAIRWVAILTLRKYFTVNVAIQPGQRLITSGVYRFLRHPSYTGSILSFVGLALTFSNWAAFIIVVVPTTLAFLHRIRIEETVLAATFTTEYEQYCRFSWRLFPGIY